MPPKSDASDDKYKYLLVCLQNIKDANGNLIQPDWKTVGAILNMKPHTAYCRYRSIVKQAVSDNATGVQDTFSKNGGPATAVHASKGGAKAKGSRASNSSTAGGGKGWKRKADDGVDDEAESAEKKMRENKKVKEEEKSEEEAALVGEDVCGVSGEVTDADAEFEVDEGFGLGI